MGRLFSRQIFNNSLILSSASGLLRSPPQYAMSSNPFWMSTSSKTGLSDFVICILFIDYNLAGSHFPCNQGLFPNFATIEVPNLAVFTDDPVTWNKVGYWIFPGR